MLQQLFKDYALPAFETLFAALLTLALTRATAWLQAHVKDVALQSALVKLTTIVGVVVREVEQTVVAQMQKNGAPLTAQQRADVLAIAVSKVKQHLGPDGIAEVGKVFGGVIDSVVTTHIEAAVHDLNNASDSTPTINVTTATAPVAA